jgi:hypothetical protein
MTPTINVTINGSVTITLTNEEGAELMAGIAGLSASVDRLTAAVDRLANAGGVGSGISQADVDAQAARVDEQSQRLEGFPTPTPPASGS